MTAPATDWHDRAAAEAAWAAYLEGHPLRGDAYGIYSVGHLMKEQRLAAMAHLRQQGFDLPRLPPDPYHAWMHGPRTPGEPVPPAPSLGDLGGDGEWLAPGLLAELARIPHDVLESAWEEGRRHAIAMADQTHDQWTTDTF